MRSDLDVIRERRVLREVREELAAHARGQWGWANLHRRARSVREPTRVATQEELTRFLPMRPGTPEGGF